MIIRHFRITISSRLFFFFVCPKHLQNFRFNSSSEKTSSDQFVGGGAPNLDENNTVNASSKNSNAKPQSTPTADFVTTCPFQCLGLTRTASKEQVREHFLQLAKVHHPDVGGESWKFKRVNAAYKQSIEMIETGYAAKTAAEMKQKKEKEEDEANAYRAPHERTQKYSSSAKTTTNSNTEKNDRYYHQKQEQYENIYADAKRTSNFSSASSYASAERRKNSSFGSNRSESSSSSSSTSRYYSEFMSSINTNFSSSEQEGKEHIRSAQMRNDKAKPHNKSQDWFKDMYQNSWSSTTANKNHQRSNSTSNGHESSSSSSDKHERDDESTTTENSSNRNQSSSSSKQTDQEFGSDEGWFEFRENYFRDSTNSFTPRDLYRFRFSQATTVKEIDDIYVESMTQNIFSGLDIGEPLHLALERYHLELGLGERHMQKCFDTIDDWERRTRSRASCIYFQCILKLYTNERMLMLFPDLDASMVAEVVWKTLEKMQQNEVPDDTGIAWWNVLNSALMYRDPHGYGGQS